MLVPHHLLSDSGFADQTLVRKMVDDELWK